ncbi:MAG: GtrA family protein [Candidatus Aenigmatarchaeota archaeon]
MTKKTAVIVIPTFNEAENIKLLIPAVLKQADKLQDINLNVLVADSHSEDKTAFEVQKLAKLDSRVHFIDVVQRGIGVGLIKGFDYAVEKLGAQILGQMDADFSHDPDKLPELFAALKNNTNFVIGSRFIKGGANHLPLIRQIFSLGASIVARFLTGYLDIKEWTTSYRIFTTDLYRKINKDLIPWQSTSFVFQIAFIVEALKAGAKVKEVPIIFTDRRFGKSKMNTFKYIFHVLVYCLRVRKQRSAIFIKFLIVGTIGFAVNTTILFILYDTSFFPLPPKYTQWHVLKFTHPDARLFISSIIAVETSIISNFLWHDKWTFRRRPKYDPLYTRFLKFNIVGIFSPIIQVITVNILTPFLGIYYLISNAIGVLLGLTWNWLWNSKVIWRG